MAAALAPAVFERVTDTYSRRECAKQLAIQGHHAVLLQLDRSDPIVLSALVRLGDCPAENQLLSAVLDDPDEFTRDIDGSFHRDDHWIHHVRCPESGPTLRTLIQKVLCQPTRGPTDVRPIFRAFERAMGAEAVDAYADLIDEGGMLDGAQITLWYMREELCERLLEEEIRRDVGDSPSTAATAMDVVEDPVGRGL